jgi:threonine dehydrogenase-like Zn-dependent dehydrogenase
MKAVVLRNDRLNVAEIADLRPGPGQTLVRTLACGICGSDLHFAQHGRRMAELSREAGAPGTLDLDRDVVMGHEFVAEVLDHGPGSEGPKPGSIVTSVPVILSQLPPTRENFRSIGYSNDFNGGYAEQMLLQTSLLLPVPNGTPVRNAALTEPLAVGIHAVAASRITAREIAVVHGCGPVGLFTIAALRLVGVETIIASDFSPARRALASHLGASIVVDPRETPVMDAWRALGRVDDVNEDGRSAMVQFEAVGVPGMINASMRDAPRAGRIVVVGACMEADTIQPIFGINKELELRFVLGYSVEEYATALRAIAEGLVDVAPMITATVDLDGVAGAFADLANPEQQVKILVEP